MANIVKELRNPKGTSGSDFNATYWHGLANKAADHIEALEEVLKKIAAIEDEHINVPKTNEGANLWACLAMCVELAEAALGEKKDASPAS